MTSQVPEPDLTALMRQLVCSLVDDPGQVHVQALEGTHSTIFEVSVAPDDVRRVIGRRGRTADALREVLLNWGGKRGRRLLLEVMEPSFRKDELPGVAGLGAPVKVERVVGPPLDVSAHHED